MDYRKLLIAASSCLLLLTSVSDVQAFMSGKRSKFISDQQLGNYNYATGLIASYGVFRIEPNYDGYVAEVTRTSDSKTLDVGLVNGYIDRYALTDFSTTDDFSDLYVSKFYDQSGDADLVPHTADSSVAHLTYNSTTGVVGVVFNDDAGYSVDLGFTPAGSEYTLVYYGTKYDTTLYGSPLSFGMQSTTDEVGGSSLALLFSGNDLYSSSLATYTGNAYTSVPTDEDLTLAGYWDISAPVSQVWVNDDSTAESSDATSTIGGTYIRVGYGRVFSTDKFDGTLYAICLHNKDKRDAMQAISTTLNNARAPAYNEAELTPNNDASILEMVGKDGAYLTLRSPSPDLDPVVVELYRDSDGATRDFKASEIVGSMLAMWSMGTTARIRTWYDISGNGHDFVQTTADAMPKLTSNGVLYTTSGGYPTARFDNEDYIGCPKFLVDDLWCSVMHVQPLNFTDDMIFTDANTNWTLMFTYGYASTAVYGSSTQNFFFYVDDEQVPLLNRDQLAYAFVEDQEHIISLAALRLNTWDSNFYFGGAANAINNGFTCELAEMVFAKDRYMKPITARLDEHFDVLDTPVEEVVWPVTNNIANIDSSMRDLSMIFSLSTRNRYYIHPVVRVKAGSNIREFTVKEINDGTFTTWAGADTPYVVGWYDQSGNGKMLRTDNDNDNSTSKAPTLVMKNGQWALYFNRAHVDYLRSTYDLQSASTDATAIMSVQPYNVPNASGVYHYIMNGNDNARFGFVYMPDGSYKMLTNTASVVTDPAETLDDWTTLTGIYDANDVDYFYKDGDLKHSSDIGYVKMERLVLGTKEDGWSTSAYNGYVRDLIVMPKMITSAERVFIESALNTQ